MINLIKNISVSTENSFLDTSIYLFQSIYAHNPIVWSHDQNGPLTEFLQLSENAAILEVMPLLILYNVFTSNGSPNKKLFKEGLFSSKNGCICITSKGGDYLKMFTTTV
jgi:hypothetical protein